jgi:hypothetical protein
MADNYTKTKADTATFASDEVSSVNYPRNKLVHGAADAVPVDTSASNPLPMQSRSVSRGFRKLTATTTATLVTALTGDGLPSGATMVLLRPVSDIRTLDDGGTLTSSFGYLVPGGTEFNYDGSAISALKVITLSGSVVVDAWFYS